MSNLSRLLAISLCYLTLSLTSSSAVAFQENSEAYQFAKKLEASFTNRNLEAVSEVIDFEQIILQATQSIESKTEDFKKKFRQGMASRIALWPQNMADLMGDYGYAKLLRVDDKTNKALFRFDLGDSGLMYIDFYLAKKNEDIFITNFYSYATGQTISQSFENMVLLIFPEKNIFEKVFGIKEQDLEPLLSLMANFGKNNDPVVFSEGFEQLPLSIKRNKLLSLVAVGLASRTNDETLYKSALAHLEKYYKDDPDSAFLLIDYYYYQNDMPKAHKLLDILSNRLALEDAGVEALRANIYLEQNELDKAQEHAERAIAMEPEQEGPYWSLAVVHSKRKEYSKTVEYFSKLTLLFDYVFDKDELLELDDYQEFAQSEEFNTWYNQPYQ